MRPDGCAQCTRGTWDGIIPSAMPSERIQRQIDVLLDQAEEASRSRDWEAVRDFAGRALTLDTENEDARAILKMAADGASTVAPLPAPEPPPALLPAGV